MLMILAALQVASAEALDVTKYFDRAVVRCRNIAAGTQYVYRNSANSFSSSSLRYLGGPLVAPCCMQPDTWSC